jgi:molybdopterin-guanine dinucleotide biosynthesis protein
VANPFPIGHHPSMIPIVSIVGKAGSGNATLIEKHFLARKETSAVSL